MWAKKRGEAALWGQQPRLVVWSSLTKHQPERLKGRSLSLAYENKDN